MFFDIIEYNYIKKKDKQMPTDLDILNQLEQAIGRKLGKLDKIKWNSVGYVQNEHYQITRLDLYDCGLNLKLEWLIHD